MAGDQGSGLSCTGSSLKQAWGISSVLEVTSLGMVFKTKGEETRESACLRVRRRGVKGWDYKERDVS